MLEHLVAHCRGVAGGDDRRGQDEPDPPAVGPGETHRQREELDGGVRVGTTAVRRAAAPCRCGGELREERRVADDDVEPARRPACPERIPDQQGGVGAERASSSVHGGTVDVDAGQHRSAARSLDSGGGGGEESAIAAGGIEDRDRRTRRRPPDQRVEHLVEDPGDELGRRVPGAEQLSCRRTRRLLQVRCDVAVPARAAVAVPAEGAGAAMATSWRIPALHGAFARRVADTATERAHATEVNRGERCVCAPGCGYRNRARTRHRGEPRRTGLGDVGQLRRRVAARDRGDRRNEPFPLVHT